VLIATHQCQPIGIVAAQQNLGSIDLPEGLRIRAAGHGGLCQRVGAEQAWLVLAPACVFGRQQRRVFALLGRQFLVQPLLGRRWRHLGGTGAEELGRAMLQRNGDPEQVGRILRTVLDVGKHRRQFQPERLRRVGHFDVVTP